MIVALDTEKVPSVNEAREAIARLRPGVVVPVDIIRGEKMLTVKVKVGAHAFGILALAHWPLSLRSTR